MRTKARGSLYSPAPRLNQLRILEEVAADHGITQTALARRCGLSVAMVNNYMKELCDGGLLEYRRQTAKTISYHVTPEGGQTAEAIQNELLLERIESFAETRDWVREIIVSQARRELHRAVLYGSGRLAEISFHALESARISVVGVCTTDPDGIGREWCGREMLNPAQIRYLAPDAVVIALEEGADPVWRALAYLAKYGIDLIRTDRVRAQVPGEPGLAADRRAPAEWHTPTLAGGQ